MRCVSQTTYLELLRDRVRLAPGLGLGEALLVSLGDRVPAREARAVPRLCNKHALEGQRALAQERTRRRRRLAPNAGAQDLGDLDERLHRQCVHRIGPHTRKVDECNEKQQRLQHKHREHQLQRMPDRPRPSAPPSGHGEKKARIGALRRFLHSSPVTR